jgi:hypothetical protein
MRKIAILPLLLLAAASPVAAQVGITAELSLDQDQYLPGEDLQLNVRMVNRSGQPITLGQDNRWITLEIVSERKEMARKLGEMPVSGQFTLLSGQAGTRALNPTPYYDFRRAGTYQVGARIKIDQWKEQITCKPVQFTVFEGVPLPNVGNLTIGLPAAPGATNGPPEIRRYSLLRVDAADGLMLYFRLTDRDGHTMRVFPLTPMISFSDPLAQIDRANNLHVLLQTGARTFTYAVIDPNGRLFIRRYFEYTQTRPALRVADDGSVVVEGGRRRSSWADIPAPGSESARSNH